MASAISPRLTVTDQGNFSSLGTQSFRPERERPPLRMLATVCRRENTGRTAPFFLPNRFTSQMNLRARITGVPSRSCLQGLVKRSPPERLFAQPAVKAGQFQFRIVESFQNFHISAAAYSCPRLQGICNAQPADRPDHC